jgi:cysteinyl-tRNA synthetase
MSKSLGNFRLVRELLKEYAGETLRFALLSSHYRSPMNFSADILQQARSGLDGLYQSLRGVEVAAIVTLPDDHAVLRALADDLNTPLAISELHGLAARLNKAEATDKPVLATELKSAAALLGLLQGDADAWFQQGSAHELSAQAIEALIAERRAAKKDKNFARADAIRDELAAQGVQLEDSREGTRWSRV